MAETGVIRTPDQRVRVFVSSTLQELAAERLDAAEAVGGGPGPADEDEDGQVIDTLGALVDASLVRDEHPAGQTRFSMLGTSGDYARERLRDSGQWNQAHDRHAAHFLGLAEAASGNPARA
jgi:predicted ATPase